MDSICDTFKTAEIHFAENNGTIRVESSSGRVQILIHGDNMEAMQYLLGSGYSGSINMIYLDPPFFSNADYLWKGQGSGEGKNVFSDVYNRSRNQYIAFLKRRLEYMRELLAPNGTIFVHLDWHIVHYVKQAMDEVFGPENFRNEIIWHYFLGGKSRRFFARKHDTILFYSKSSGWKFHPLKVRRRLDYVPTLPARSSSGKPVDNTTGKDEAGWYSNVTADDVWDIPGVFNLSKEYTGFPTQKPIALLRRIIGAVTDPGDIVADFFCGSGTALEAASIDGRAWIGCDSSQVSVETSLSRVLRHLSNTSPKVEIMRPDSSKSDRHRQAVSEAICRALQADPILDDGHFIGVSGSTAIFLADSRPPFSETESGKLLDIISESTYSSAVVVSSAWNLPASEEGFSVSHLRRKNLELVNLSAFGFDYAGGEVLPQKPAISVTLNVIRELSFSLDDRKLELTALGLGDAFSSGNETGELIDAGHVTHWYLDGAFDGNALNVKHRDDLYAQTSAGRIAVHLDMGKNGNRIANRLVFDNSGSVFAVLQS